MKKTEAICTFLNNCALPDLANLYNYGMECQVNVAQDNGEKIQGDFKGKAWHGFSDGVETWKSFRIPYNAATDPSYEDTELTFDFSKHVESIGLTGWDWVNKKSIWVGIDFDAVASHAQGLRPEELERVEKDLCALPYATVRRSTSGNGLHVYVFFKEPIPTENHNEHAALARAVLAKMSFDLNIDFAAKADVVGNNLWVWHRKFVNSGGLGLKLIKQGIPLEEAPADWQIHLSVIKNQRNKAIKKEFDDDGEQESFEKFAEQRPNIVIDAEHRKIIEQLKDDPDWETYYNQEYNCLITHTLALKKVYKDLKLKGMFETTSSGSTTKNCFCFPAPKGGFVVYRFGRNVSEHSSWTKEQNGYVRAYFNMAPSIREAAGFFGGLENDKGNFSFMRAKDAIASLALMGIEVTIPEAIYEHPTIITDKKDGRVIVEIDHLNKMNSVLMPDWIAKPKVWQKVFSKNIVNTNKVDPVVQAPMHDSSIRFLVSEDSEEIGWYYWLYAKNEWASYEKDNCVSGLRNLGYTQEEIVEAIGVCVNNPWTRVNKPFQPEYTGNREWNKTKAQFAVPVKPKFTEGLHYPTWNKIFYHVGKDLDEIVIKDKWCIENGVTSGADYLKVWCAWMFQYPEERLPYLFFYSQQQHTGKSSFHQALSLLMRGGYVKADNCLKEKFNGELAESVLCVIEEIDLGKDRNAYNKVKDFTTAPKIGIRALYENHTQVTNTTHWVQTANDISYLAIEPGDTRIVAIEVFEIPPHELMDTNEMTRNLMKEASDFLTELMHLELPKPMPGRTPMPVLRTFTKDRAEKKKESALDAFIREKCFYVPGVMMPLCDFYAEFSSYLDPAERAGWTKQRIGRDLPDKYVKGKSKKDNGTYIGNISFEPKSSNKPKLIVDGRGYFV